MDAYLQERAQRKRAARRRLAQFLALAILIHLAVIPPLAYLIPDPEPLGERPKKVRMIALSGGAQSHKIKLPKRKREIEPAQKKEEEKKSEDVKGQIVDIPPTRPDEEAPEDAKYLSENNTRTERETKSRFRDKNYKNAMNELSTARKPELAKPNPSEKMTALEIGPENPNVKKNKSGGQEQVFELPKQQEKQALALKLDPELGTFRNRDRIQELRGKGDRLRLSLGDPNDEKKSNGSAPTKAPQATALFPAVGVLAKLSGGPANDDLRDLEEGDGTFLNSREFKYASFFNRMKRGVSQHWNPMLEYRRRDPTGNIYGQQSRITVLKVTLNKDGSLKKVDVSRSSGIDFLDREAVSAFRRAEPFPNPPNGLVDGTSGSIEFPFGFHLEFTRHGGLRLPF